MTRAAGGGATAPTGCGTAGNTMNVLAEVVQKTYPIRVVKYGLDL